MVNRGFFTLEAMISFTMFILILLGFQSAFRHALRASKWVENHYWKQIEERLCFESLSRDLQYRIPLRDGRDFYMEQNDQKMILRFISQSLPGFPPKKAEGMILIQYEFFRKKGEAFLVRSSKPVSGYDERILIQPLENGAARSWDLGKNLNAIIQEGVQSLGWFSRTKTIVFRWGEEGEIGKEYKFHLFLFKEKEKE